MGGVLTIYEAYRLHRCKQGSILDTGQEDIPSRVTNFTDSSHRTSEVYRGCPVSSRVMHVRCVMPVACRVGAAGQISLS
jgi:hypothetical protein